jgi:hypothetical protein
MSPQAVRTSQSVLAKEKAAIVNDFAPDKKVSSSQHRPAVRSKALPVGVWLWATSSGLRP